MQLLARASPKLPHPFGNSGGPLLSDDGKIVGVNSFIRTDAEGLNFAVAAKEISYFLRNKANGMEALNTCDQTKPIFEGRNQENTGFIRMISLQCDAKADVTIVALDDKTQPIYALVDLKRRGKPEGIVFDVGRTGKWSNSYWDTKLDDIFPSEGYILTGSLCRRPTSHAAVRGNRLQTSSARERFRSLAAPQPR